MIEDQLLVQALGHMHRVLSLYDPVTTFLTTNFPLVRTLS